MYVCAELMPDFCYQTPYEIMTMIECFYDGEGCDVEIDPKTIAVVLSRFFRQGFLDRKPVPTHELTKGRYGRLSLATRWQYKGKKWKNR